MKIWHSEFDGTLTEADEHTELLEKLAALEHDQWVEWAKAIAENETISKARTKRWEKLYVPYDELPEESKEQDRVFARKVLAALKREKLTEAKYTDR